MPPVMVRETRYRVRATRAPGLTVRALVVLAAFAGAAAGGAVALLLGGAP